MTKKPKILIFDIETLGLKANDPLLCIAWKVFGEDKINFRATWNSVRWRELKAAKTPKAIETAFQNLDKDILADIYEEFSTADCLVGHYETYFDVPFLKSRLIKHGYGFLPKSQLTDTWFILRKNLALRSNRLGAVNEFLGIEKKLKQSDLSLWTAVKTGSRAAFKIMEKYNKQDVIATESLLRKLIGYAKLPRLITDGIRLCHCGSRAVEKHSIRATMSGQYQRYRCRSCGSYSKSLIKKPELRPES